MFDGFLKQTAIQIKTDRGNKPVLLGAKPDRPGSIAGTNCWVYFDPRSFDALLTFPATSSSWTRGLPLPADPGLKGLTAVIQAAWGPTTTPLFADLTNGVFLTLGD